MPKKNSDETTPLQPKKAADKTKPVDSKVSSIEQKVVVAPKPRKSSKKKEVIETPLEGANEEIIYPDDETELPPKKQKRAGWIWLGILGMLLIVVAGIAIGYGSAIQVRKVEEVNQRLVVATTQFELSLQNISSGNLDLAKRRLEYVIQIYPNYPGAADKLAEVMVTMAQTNQAASNSASVPEVEATKDTRGAAAIFNQAQQQLVNQDWQNLYTSVLSLRNLDPSYEALKVDGMYYLALRNVGINNIKSGNLEKGIFQFAVAEQIAPIDADADNWRKLAKMYIDGEVNWGVNWQIAVNNFVQLYQTYPYMSDFNGVTSKQRYAEALEGLGDTYVSTYNYCDAVTQYGLSASIVSSQTLSDKITQAQADCANPPATPTPTINPNIVIPPTPTNG